MQPTVEKPMRCGPGLVPCASDESQSRGRLRHPALQPMQRMRTSLACGCQKHLQGLTVHRQVRPPRRVASHKVFWIVWKAPGNPDLEQPSLLVRTIGAGKPDLTFDPVGARAVPIVAGVGKRLQMLFGMPGPLAPILRAAPINGPGRHRVHEPHDFGQSEIRLEHGHDFCLGGHFLIGGYGQHADRVHGPGD